MPSFGPAFDASSHERRLFRTHNFCLNTTDIDQSRKSTTTAAMVRFSPRVERLMRDDLVNEGVDPNATVNINVAAPATSTMPPAQLPPAPALPTASTQQTHASAPATGATRSAAGAGITIAVKVGPEVRMYKAHGEVWMAFINGQACTVMPADLFAKTDTVRGIKQRAQAILSQPNHQLEVPPQVLHAMTEDLRHRKNVSQEYLQRSQHAHPFSPIMVGNRAHKHFQDNMKEALELLERHALAAGTGSSAA
ncbi:hypothetical protein HII31_00663 [Pseudocercospora fuligena]|uniref:Uncharacterized protein n=1 Tax=Pseudocercospora fuligena TaxID=685502 RepID=A0A8H6RUZ8_9PEZI|nr:hypothetical protein HII31_00663 [Pseudocercospora fuligena]